MRLSGFLLSLAAAVAAAAVLTAIGSAGTATGADCVTDGVCNASWNGYWALGPTQYACWRPGRKVKWIFHLYPNPNDPLHKFALSFALHNLRIVGKSGSGTLASSNGRPTIVIENISHPQTFSVVMYVNRNAAHGTYFVGGVTATSASGKRTHKFLMRLPRLPRDNC